jgi:hypothetical protein
MFPLEEHYLMDRVQAYDPNTDKPQPQAVMDDLKYHASSFSNECRVYGRLKELGREDLAIKAHGYLRVYLTNNLQQQWNAAVAQAIPHSQVMQQAHAPQTILSHHNLAVPVYAIVKDWNPDHRDPHPMSNDVKRRQIKHIPQMLRDLHSLHKCGIVVRDLKEQQYYEGKIGDFSHAWTVPHILGPGNDVRPVWAWRSMAAWDLRCFQVDIIDEWKDIADNNHPRLKAPTTVAWNNGATRYPLRNRPDVVIGPKLPLVKYDDQQDYEMNYDPPFDPSDFNWQFLEKKKTEQGIVTGRVGKRRAAAQATGGKAKRPKIILKVRGRAKP